MPRPAGSHHRTLDRIEQAVADLLGRTPAVADGPRPERSSHLPAGLERAAEQLARLEATLAGAQAAAGRIEQLLEAEADAFSAWVERLVRVKGQLQGWASGQDDDAG